MDKQALREKLSYGMIKEIAESNGLSTKTVSNFINGKTNSLKVERAVLSTIKQINNDRSQALNI